VIVALATGNEHILALSSDGIVYAWGRGIYGQLGSSNNNDGPVTVNTAAGVSALAGKTVITIAANGRHSLAVADDGTVCTWGANSSGQLGNNSTNNSFVPVAVDTTGILADTNVVALGVGRNGDQSLVLATST